MWTYKGNIASIDNKVIYGYGYNYAKTITIDYTKVSGTANLIDFPVMISLTGVTTVNANGYDVLFTDVNFNPLDYQLEYYAAGTSYIAWVRIPSLSYTQNTIIKMFYGNARITTNQSKSTVWNSTYRNVYHLSNNVFTDGTAYTNDLTNVSTTNVAGIIGNARNFNGSNAYLRNTTLNGFTSNNVETISCWAKYASTATQARNLVVVQNQPNKKSTNMMFRSSGGYGFGAWMYGGNMIIASNIFPTINEWHYYGYTFDGTYASLYIDGERVAYALPVVAPQLDTWDTISVGAYYDVSAGEHWAGQIDEVHYSTGAKSLDWFKTEYNNQNSPQTFYTVN